MEEQRPSALIPMGSEEPVPEFDVVLRGYDRRQVDEYLDRLEADLATAQSERATLVARSESLDKQLSEQDREVASARQQLVESAQPTYAGLGARVQQMLTLAEEEAAEIRSKATADAAEIRSSAEKDTAHLREHADAIIGDAKAKADAQTKDHESALTQRQQKAAQEDKDRRMAAERQATELTGKAQQELAASQQHAQQVRADAEQHARTLRTDAEQHAGRVRGEADTHAESLVSAARADAERLVREAEEHRAQLFATAKDDADRNRAALLAEIRQLEQRRDGVHAQIDSLRQALGGVPAPMSAPVDGANEQAPQGQGAPGGQQPAPDQHTQVFPSVGDQH